VTKYKIKFLTPAIKEIEKIAEYYLKMVGPKSAKQITDFLLETIQTLEDQPFLGAKHPDVILQNKGFRKLICGDYICIYKLIDTEVFIYRVVHGTTDYPESFK
jgi:toxin ParE1/3/4